MERIRALPLLYTCTDQVPESLNRNVSLRKVRSNLRRENRHTLYLVRRFIPISQEIRKNEVKYYWPGEHWIKVIESIWSELVDLQKINNMGNFGWKKSSSEITGWLDGQRTPLGRNSSLCELKFVYPPCLSISRTIM